MTEKEILIFFFDEIRKKLEEMAGDSVANLLNLEQIETIGLSNQHKNDFWLKVKKDLLEEFKRGSIGASLKRLSKTDYTSLYVGNELLMYDLREKYNHPSWREDHIIERASFYKYAAVIEFINKKIIEYSDPAIEHSNATRPAQGTNLGSIPIKNVINIHQDYREKVIEAIQHFFPTDQQDELAALISGEVVEKKLLFQASAVRLIFVFKRLKADGFIVQDEKEISDWLYGSFDYFDKNTRQVKSFDPLYCLKILSKTDLSISAKNIIPVEGLSNMSNNY